MHLRPTRVAGVAIVTIFGLIFIGACASAPEVRTPEQKRYLAHAESAPLEFSMRRSELDAVIDRTMEWLSTYHSLKETDADRKVFKSLVREHNAGMIFSPMTYRIADLGSHAYFVDFVLNGGVVDVHVNYKHEGGFGLGDVVAHRAHLLAYYIKTGQMMPELLDA